MAADARSCGKVGAAAVIMPVVVLENQTAAAAASIDHAVHASLLDDLMAHVAAW